MVEKTKIKRTKLSKNISNSKEKQNIDGVSAYNKQHSVSNEDLDSKDQKVLISIRLDRDVLDAVKKKSGNRGYQTLINDILRREFIYNETFSIVIRNLEDRIKRIEKAILKT